MAKLFPFVHFKREDHLYSNDAFAELCKDAVRAFNGTPVCECRPQLSKEQGSMRYIARQRLAFTSVMEIKSIAWATMSLSM